MHITDSTRDRYDILTKQQMIPVGKHGNEVRSKLCVKWNASSSCGIGRVIKVSVTSNVTLTDNKLPTLKFAEVELLQLCCMRQCLTTERWTGLMRKIWHAGHYGSVIWGSMMCTIAHKLTFKAIVKRGPSPAVDCFWRVLYTNSVITNPTPNVFYYYLSILQCWQFFFCHVALGQVCQPDHQMLCSWLVGTAGLCVDGVAALISKALC